jgi:hypothetical protein
MNLDNNSIFDFKNPLEKYKYIIEKYAKLNHIALYQMYINQVYYTCNISISKIDYSINSVKVKFERLNAILSNPFMNEACKTDFLNVFSVFQKGFSGIQRFVYLTRFNKSHIYNYTDLYGDIIPENTKVAITLFQNNTRYIFLLRELMKTITISLTNSLHFFSEPLCCKNPYTNSPFTKSALYNIYFAIRFYSSLKLPHIFHQYFIYDFNLYFFSVKNETILMDEHLTQYLSGDANYTNCNIRELVVDVFRENNIMFLNIHRDFPRDQLFRIMKPYLDIYYASVYTLNNGLSNFYRVVLKYLIIRFMKYNIYFGRKRVIVEKQFYNKIHRYTGFNDDCIKYEFPISIEYMSSHLSSDCEKYKHMVGEIWESTSWILLMNQSHGMNPVENTILGNNLIDMTTDDGASTDDSNPNEDEPEIED